MRYQGKTFRNERVELDGNEFDGCTFENCYLIYRATAVMSLTNCPLPGSNFVFEDGARLAINFLQAIYHGGFEPIVNQLFDNIRAGNIPSAGGGTTP